MLAILAVGLIGFVSAQTCLQNQVQTPVCDYGTVLAGNGGCGGTLFQFQSSTCSSSLKEIRCWTKPGDNSLNFIRGLQVTLFSGASQTFGDVSGNPEASLELLDTDRISSPIMLGRYTAISGEIQAGSIHFSVSSGRTFTCGIRRNEVSRGCVDCYIIGVHGRRNGNIDIDSLGFIVTNFPGQSSISSGVLTDITYPNLNVMDPGKPNKRLESILCNDANVTQTLSQKYLKSDGKGNKITKIDGKTFENGFKVSAKVSAEFDSDISVGWEASASAATNNKWVQKRSDTKSNLTTTETVEESEITVDVPPRTRAISNLVWFEKHVRFYFTGVFELRFIPFTSVIRFPVQGNRVQVMTSTLHGSWSFENLRPGQGCIDLNNFE